MEKLNELVEMAKASDGKWFATAINPESILAIAEAFRELEQRVLAAEAKVCQDPECHSDFMPVFEEMVKRGKENDALQAQLDEMANQEPVGYTYNRGINCEIVAADLNDDCPCGVDLYSRPAPAVSLAELVPDALLPYPSNDVAEKAHNAGWNACRAAILRNIEEAK